MHSNVRCVMALEHFALEQRCVKAAREKDTFLCLLERWIEGIMKDIRDNFRGFIQLNRNNEVFSLIKNRHSAYSLLTIIALRARRTTERCFDGLRIGEALIGDYESYGATEQIYRSDKKFLEKYGLATFKTTTKGTIAQLTGSIIFDINEEEITGKITDPQRPAHEPPTTNNKENNGKNEKNSKSRLHKNLNESQLYKKKYFPTNPKSFAPSNAGEAAALDTWSMLEPFNPFAFQTTYLWAYKKKLPPDLFYQFTSEIQQDDSVKNKGAVFRTKVEDYLNKK